MKKLVAATFIAILAITPAFSHSGGTNSAGCHAGSKPYHCHSSKPNYNRSKTYTVVLPGGQRWKGYSYATCQYYALRYNGYCVKE